MLKIAWNEMYAHNLPEGHRFPMLKYELIPQQLLYEGTITSANLFSPELLAEEEILHTHDADYWLKLKNGQLTKAEIRKTGFPYSKALVLRERTINQGTIDCANYAMKYGVALNVAGGTHHAFHDRGEGFCLLNDQAIAANYLMRNGLAKRILIIDLDVHQGNGTASIFANQPNVFTFSMHGAKNYPLVKPPSDLDVALADGVSDKEYMLALNKSLEAITARFTPDFVFYQSGVDVLASDKLGRLGLSLNGCKERDIIVLSFVKRLSVPLVICMGGGYSEKIQTIVEAHANVFRLAQDFFF